MIGFLQQQRGWEAAGEGAEGRHERCGDDEPHGDARHDEGEHHLHRAQHGHDGHHQPVLPGLHLGQSKQGVMQARAFVERCAFRVLASRGVCTTRVRPT